MKLDKILKITQKRYCNVFKAFSERIEYTIFEDVQIRKQPQRWLDNRMAPIYIRTNCKTW